MTDLNSFIGNRYCSKYVLVAKAGDLGKVDTGASVSCIIGRSIVFQALERADIRGQPDIGLTRQLSRPAGAPEAVKSR